MLLLPSAWLLLLLQASQVRDEGRPQASRVANNHAQRTPRPAVRGQLVLLWAARIEQLHGKGVHDVEPRGGEGALERSRHRGGGGGGSSGIRRHHAGGVLVCWW